MKHRKDRKKQILSQLSSLKVKKEKIIKVEGYQDILNGYKGCVLSHIKALNYAIKNNLNNVLVLEDDVYFTKPTKTLNCLIDFFLKNIKNWDVFFLGGKFYKKIKTPYRHILRITKSLDAHAYAVDKKYFKILKDNYLQGYEIIKNEHFFIQSWKSKKSILDTHWQKLQKKDFWYGLDVLLAIQNVGFSDNEFKQRNYTNELIKILS